MIGQEPGAATQGRGRREGRWCVEREEEVKAF